MITIDLFSDTNSDPVQAMRQAMAVAKVGNEVAGEDPAVNELLATVCQLLNKPAAIFLPSGTMCNGIAYRVFCHAGDRIILDYQAHPLHMSAGLLGGLVGATTEVIRTERGIFNAEQLTGAIGNNVGYNVAKAKVVSVEQTTNLGGGAIWPLETLRDVCAVAHQHNIAVHMDGARLLNAVVASNISATEYCEHVDSVWIDFSKGLGAPMGAVLCGSQAFIDQAWYYKFQQGGGMHQAGIIAAGCLYALKHHIERLAEDHSRAKHLAAGLAGLPNIELKLDEVETNIVIFKINHPKITALKLTAALLKQGIRMLALDDHFVRAIIHLDISDVDIQQVIAAVRDCVKHKSVETLAA